MQFSTNTWTTVLFPLVVLKINSSVLGYSGAQKFCKDFYNFFTWITEMLSPGLHCTLEQRSPFPRRFQEGMKFECCTNTIMGHQRDRVLPNLSTPSLGVLCPPSRFCTNQWSFWITPASPSWVLKPPDLCFASCSFSRYTLGPSQQEPSDMCCTTSSSLSWLEVE